MQRIESSVTSISWIPSEAIDGMTRLPFDAGITHYDDPPPDALTDLEQLRQQDRFRFANELRAWIDVDGGEVVGWGQSGRGHMGVTRVALGGLRLSFAAVSLPDLRPDVEVGRTFARFRQTAGGRTGLAAPRRVRHRPFVQLAAPLAWTTLALTIHADGTSDRSVEGASSFPRHWIYDDAGALTAKTGLVDFTGWYRGAFGAHTPWGRADSPAVVAGVETGLERELSRQIMRGSSKPRIRRVARGALLARQGEPGDELFLLLDGILRVDVDGEPLAELGPGAVLGERAILEEGLRTSTLAAVTPCRVAVAGRQEIAEEALHELAQGHRREQPPPA